MEFAGIAFLFLTQLMRINLGQTANRTENTKAMGLFLMFSVFVLGFYIYFGFYTTFVIVLDIIFASLGLLFVIIQIVLSFAALIHFAQK